MLFNGKREISFLRLPRFMIFEIRLPHPSPEILKTLSTAKIKDPIPAAFIDADQRRLMTSQPSRVFRSASTITTRRVSYSGAQMRDGHDTESHRYATLLRRKKRIASPIKMTPVLRDSRAARRGAGLANDRSINRASTCPNKLGLRSVDLKTDFYRAA